MLEMHALKLFIKSFKQRLHFIDHGEKLLHRQLTLQICLTVLLLVCLHSSKTKCSFCYSKVTKNCSER